MRAQLYRAFVKLGFTPSQVDSMEIWQAAALLGVDEKEDPVLDDDRYVGTFDAGRAGMRPLTEADRRRLEKFGQPAEDRVDITSDVMRQMGIRTN